MELFPDIFWKNQNKYVNNGTLQEREQAKIGDVRKRNSKLSFKTIKQILPFKNMKAIGKFCQKKNGRRNKCHLEREATKNSILHVGHCKEVQ